MVTAAQVKKLRERTSAGMMDCKNALDASNSDIEKAIKWLRENGISKAAKKVNRIAAEGLTRVASKGNRAIILELNSETDFVAQNKKFLNLLENITNAILESNVKTLEDALKIEINGETLETIVINGASMIGEKLSLRRLNTFEKTNDQTFGTYMHAGGKISSLIILNGGNEEIIKQVCMHIAAAKPQFLKAEDIDSNTIANEKEILLKEALNEGKPKEIAEKMVEGRIRKFLEEICLEEQVYVFDSKLKIKDLVGSIEASIIQFIRYEVGEGIEKKEDNFTEEVMKQVSSS